MYLDLQARKKLAQGGIKAFDTNMCRSVNVKKWIAILWTQILKYATQYNI